MVVKNPGWFPKGFHPGFFYVEPLIVAELPVVVELPKAIGEIDENPGPHPHVKGVTAKRQYKAFQFLSL